MASEREDIVRKIIDTCRSIRAATKPTSQDKPQSKPHFRPPLSLPPIPDVASELLSMGVVSHKMHLFTDLFHSKCVQLEKVHYDEYSKMVASVGSPRLYGPLQQWVTKSYTEKVTHIRSEFLRSIRQKCDKLRSDPPTPVQTKKSSKASFNHDYAPVLEKYFEYNAYPSVADRALMARKSMMTERQIEVWFQNHRNRARKDGKPLTRLRASDLLPSDVSFDSLGDTMSDLLRPANERLMMEQLDNEDDDSDGIQSLALSLNVATTSRAGSVDSELGTSAPTASPQEPIRDPLNPLTPPFAYPALYVPQLHTFLDATSRPAASTFSHPTWARQASTTRSKSSAKLCRRDIDAFADLFARLNVREGVQKQGHRRIAPLPQSRNSPVLGQQRYASPAATYAITTILCPGRHPAFIPSVAPRATRRARKSPSPPPPPPYQSWMSSPGAGPSKSSTSSTSATAFTFQSPPQYSQSAVPTSPSNASPETSPATPRRRRKSPQLPRRVPGSSPVTHSYSQSQNQTTSHPTPQRSPRPSHHPYASPSRASSSTSSHRVSSSSSSSASSSTPTTPNGSTTSLPMSYPASTPKNTKPTSPMFTVQNIADIFGDAAAFTAPSSQGFSGFGTAGFDSPDFGRMQMGNMFDFSFNTSHGPSIVQARS
ncbi:hypothetical protein EYR40_003739 [Pleurotus pulmonarius]|nr:hypothetical protein EYR40_003739 [Pleurotus pulmonarius]KAF4606449.1 hypothetical protein EYR38_000503 [Pleurotus pulmonarius]